MGTPGNGARPPPRLHHARLLPSPRPHRSPPGTHGSRQQGSRRLRPRSPCPRRRASAPARRRKCRGTGRIPRCRWSALGKGEAGRRPITPATGEPTLLGSAPPRLGGPQATEAGRAVRTTAQERKGGRRDGGRGRDAERGSGGAGRDGEGLEQTHGSGCPRRSRPRSRPPHRTPRAWRCSGGCCTQTARGSRTCLGEEETRGGIRAGAMPGVGGEGRGSRAQPGWAGRTAGLEPRVVLGLLLAHTAPTGTAAAGLVWDSPSGAGEVPQFLSTIWGRLELKT